MKDESWIGVDLDGTLAYYDHWRGEEHIGDIITEMKMRVIHWLGKGQTVKIFTARAINGERQIEIIHNWLEANNLPRLTVTNVKDFNMIELWDDRAVQIVPNTGQRADGKP